MLDIVEHLESITDNDPLVRRIDAAYRLNDLGDVLPGEAGRELIRTWGFQQRDCRASPRGFLEALATAAEDDAVDYERQFIRWPREGR